MSQTETATPESNSCELACPRKWATILKRATDIHSTYSSTSEFVEFVSTARYYILNRGGAFLTHAARKLTQYDTILKQSARSDCICGLFPILQQLYICCLTDVNELNYEAEDRFTSPVLKFQQIGVQ